MTGEKTTVWVSVETKARLDKLGGKGDTYDGIIRRLLDQQARKKK